MSFLTYNYIDFFIVVYLDDIVVYSESLEDHLYSSLGCSVACLSINASTAVRSRGSPPLIRDGIYDSKGSVS